MKSNALWGASLAVCIVVGSACGLFSTAPLAPSNPSPVPEAVVDGLAAAWNAATVACLAAEDAGAVGHGKCAAALLPAHDALLSAASAVDAYNTGRANNFPCAIAAAITSLSQVETLLIDSGVKVPSAVPEGITLAQQLAGSACSDAGAE